MSVMVLDQRSFRVHCASVIVLDQKSFRAHHVSVTVLDQVPSRAERCRPEARREKFSCEDLKPLDDYLGQAGRRSAWV